MPVTLEQFKKPKAVPHDFPSWATSHTTQKLYTATIDIYNKIQIEIEQSSDIGLRARQLISKHIAEHCGLSRSIITKRRQPEIVELIKELNEELETIFKSSSAKKWSSGKKLTKEELIKENKRLKAENLELRNISLSAFATTILESSILADTRSYVLTINKLKEEIERQRNVIDNQAEQHRKFMDALTQ